MCARRFLFVVFILILLVIGGAFLIFQFGQQVLINSATPKGHFQAPSPSDAGPDYSDAANWIARPDMEPRDNPSLWRPTNWPPPTLQPRSVAAFFIHPTTYLQTDRWNAPISGSRDSDDRAKLFVQSQASAFNDVAQIWAPRYRQAAYGAFLLNNDDAKRALALAYSDVRRAFEAFLAEIPADQPIILAGHSQGSLHLSRLLTDFAPRLKGRLVAAYVVGWPISTTADLPASGLSPCASPTSTGCVLSWQSFGDPANPKLVLDAWAGTKGASGVERRRSDMLCVNPITGTSGGAASPSDNPGTLMPNGSLSSASIEPGLVGARCEKGFLLIDGNIPPLGPFVLPGNNYHVYDYALFWGAVRRDAQRRAQAWAER